MALKIISVDDVFGINRDLPLNYQARDTADAILVDNLARNHHLVIYGSSKQGKTSLRKHCLNPDDYIVIHCSNKWGLEGVHEAILKQAGYELTLSKTIATSGKQKIFAKIKASFWGASAEGGAEAERTNSTDITTTPLEIDPLDVNDIISALNQISFNKYIVCGLFHVLLPAEQTDLMKHLPQQQLCMLFYVSLERSLY